jgi:hypothetical protein
MGSKRIGENHQQKFLLPNIKDIPLKVDDLSEPDLALIVGSYIKELSGTGSYAAAQMIMESILHSKDYLSQIQIEEILSNAEANTYDQVLDANYAYQFFPELLQVTYNKGFELDSWVAFYNRLTNAQKVRFSDIRRSLKQKRVAGIMNPEGDEFMDPEDIPF